MGLAWLTARPIAHRGYHDRSAGRIENTLSAAEAAIAKSFAIECDLQLTADGEAIVFHDDTLDRLTEAAVGPLRTRTLAELKAMALRDTDDRIPTFAEFLALIDDRVPLVAELKSDWSGDRRLEARVATILSAYRGRVAVMSFDPDSMRAMKRLAPHLPRGLTADAFADGPDWGHLSAAPPLRPPPSPGRRRYASSLRLLWDPRPAGAGTASSAPSRHSPDLLDDPHAGGLGEGAPLYRPDHVRGFRPRRLSLPRENLRVGMANREQILRDRDRNGDASRRLLLERDRARRLGRLRQSGAVAARQWRHAGGQACPRPPAPGGLPARPGRSRPLQLRRTTRSWRMISSGRSKNRARRRARPAGSASISSSTERTASRRRSSRAISSPTRWANTCSTMAGRMPSSAPAGATTRSSRPRSRSPR